MAARDRERALAGFHQRHRSRERAGGAVEGLVLGRVAVHRAGLECAAECDGRGAVGTDVEEHRLPGGEGSVGSALGPTTRNAVVPRRAAGSAAPDEIRFHHRRRRRRGHAGAEVVVHVARLHVALGGRLAAVLRVVHQRRNAEGGAVAVLRRVGVAGHVDAQLRVVGRHAEQFLAPVAENVAPVLRTSAVGDVVVVGRIRSRRVAVEADDPRAAAVRSVELVDAGAGRRAADGRNELAHEIAIPPDRFRRERFVGVRKRVALAVEDARLRGEELAPFHRGIEVAGHAAADVDHAAGVPLLDHGAAARIEDRGGEAGAVVLLDDEIFQARAVGIDVGQVKAVAVDDFGDVEKLRAVVVEHVADIDELVLAVVVHVGDADLVTLRRMLPTGVHPRPELAERASPPVPGGDDAVEALVRCPVLSRPHDGRTFAIQIKNAHVAVHRAVREAWVWCAGAGQFGAGEPVDDRKELDVVARPTGDGGAVAEDHAIGSAEQDLRLAVAVHVVDGHVIAVANADGGRPRLDVVFVKTVRAEIDPPEQGAVAQVAFEELAEPVGGLAVHDEVVFAVAVQIADPAEFHIQRAVGRRLQGHRDVLARGRIDGQGECGARRVRPQVGDFNAADHGPDGISVGGGGEVAWRVEMVGGGRERRDVELDRRGPVGRAVEIEGDVGRVVS